MHRLDKQVAEETDQQKASHDVHGHVVGIGLRYAVGYGVLADIIHQHRTEDASHRPRSQQQAVYGTDVACAKHVLEIGGYRRKAATVHADDHEEAADETDHTADRSHSWYGAVQDEAEDHEHEVGVLASDIVRCGGPKEPASHIEQAHQNDKARRRHGRHSPREHLLAHRGRLLAEMKKPPAQHRAAVNIARRGPPSSTQRPNTADETPRKNMAREKIHPSSGRVQSFGADCEMPMSLVIGKLKTLNA